MPGAQWRDIADGRCQTLGVVASGKRAESSRFSSLAVLSPLHRSQRHTERLRGGRHSLSPRNARYGCRQRANKLLGSCPVMSLCPHLLYRSIIVPMWMLKAALTRTRRLTSKFSTYCAMNLSCLGVLNPHNVRRRGPNQIHKLAFFRRVQLPIRRSLQKCIYAAPVPSQLLFCCIKQNPAQYLPPKMPQLGRSVRPSFRYSRYTCFSPNLTPLQFTNSRIP